MRDLIAVPLGTDFEVDLDLTAFDQALREDLGAAGETVTFFFAATPAGATIHADLSVALTDLGDGRYYGTISGAFLTAQLAAYVGQRVFPRLVVAEACFDGVFADADYIVTDVAEVQP